MHPDQQRTSFLQRVHMDAPLLFALLITAVVSIFTVYSASGENLGMTERQAIRVGAAFSPCS